MQQRWLKMMRNGIRKIVVLGLMLSMTGMTVVWADTAGNGENDGPERNWELILGAGTLGEPDYRGADNLNFTSVPLIIGFYETRYLSLFIEGKEAGAKFGMGTDLPLALKVGIGLGDGRKHDDADLLAGTATLDSPYRLFGGLGVDLGLAEISAKAEYYPITAEYADVKQANADYNGLLTSVEVGRDFRPFRFLIVKVGSGLNWMNSDYAEAYYGVQYPTAKLASFQAESGIQAGSLSVQALMFFSERMGVVGRFKGSYLLGDAAESPLAKNDFQPSVGAFVFYRF